VRFRAAASATARQTIRNSPAIKHLLAARLKSRESTPLLCVKEKAVMLTSIAKGGRTPQAPTCDFRNVRLRFDPFLDVIPDRLIPHVIASVRRHRRQ
jgi:hypothetical protein